MIPVRMVELMIQAGNKCFHILSLFHHLDNVVVKIYIILYHVVNQSPVATYRAVETVLVQLIGPFWIIADGLFFINHLKT
jgi:hypothetical protein